MCGISGWFNRNGAPVDTEVLRAMTDTLAHRGPDDSAVWTDGAIGLGHRRLSIRDLSKAGRQPMSDRSRRIFVTYNGELYNDGELRKELESGFGFEFQTGCDTEILPLGYLAWGERLFDRLEGMYSIGLWDSEHRKLLLARDGVGVKPLYFHSSQELVLFGSEIKALLAHPAMRKTLDPEALHTFLAAGHCGPSHSLIAGIRQVPPGSVVAFSAFDRQERRFWRPRRTGELTDLTAALEEFEPLWHDVVSSQLVSDVPIGVLQSGGIDSSLVSLSLFKQGKRTPLFTSSFDEVSYDESHLAAQVAATTGFEHHVLPVHVDTDAIGTFRAVVDHFDGQCADTGSYAYYRLCEAVRRQAKVVLSGDGGDEFFGGYDTYRASRLAAQLAPLPRSLLNVAGRFAYRSAAANEKRMPFPAVAARFALGLANGGAYAHTQWRRLLPAFLITKLYGPELLPLAGESPYAEYEKLMDESPGELVDRCLLADQQFHLPSVLAKVDAMSMAHSLEVRVPLLDRRIMEFAGRCSTELLVPRHGAGKLLLRQAAARLGAPRMVLEARKRGFNVPLANLLRNALAPLAEECLERSPDILSPYFSPDSVRRLWREHRDRRTNHEFALWPILMLAVWLGTPVKRPQVSREGYVVGG